MAFANFSLTDLYTAVVSKLNSQLQKVASLFKDQTTGDFDNQIRYSSANRRLEYWNGSSWLALDISASAIMSAEQISGLSVDQFAVHRTEGTGYVDYARNVYDNGAGGGAVGWVEPTSVIAVKARNAYDNGDGGGTVAWKEPTAVIPVKARSAISTYGTTAGYQVFNASGNFTVPANVTRLFIEGWGGGGGGGGYTGGPNGTTAGSGADGGNSTVNGTVIAAGGKGGAGSNWSVGLSHSGAAGAGGTASAVGCAGNAGGDGNSGPSNGGANVWAQAKNFTVGAGGGNNKVAGSNAGGGGGAGAYDLAFMTVTPGATIPVVVGAGGGGGAGAGTSAVTGAPGAAGRIIIWY